MHEVIVHTITLADVEDPEVYIAEPLLNWQHSEEGRWVMQHSKNTPMWRRSPNHGYYYIYDIVAWFNDIDYTYWKLKYE